MTQRALVAHDAHAVARPRSWLLPSPSFARSAPFAGATILAVAALGLAGTLTNPALVVLGTVLALTIAVAALLVPWGRMPAWIDTVFAVGFMVALGAFREGAGGVSSGYAPLLLIPMLWLALVGTTRRAWLGLFAMAVILAAPMFPHPIGGGEYWRRLGLLLLAGGFSVVMVRRLVAEADGAAREIGRQAQRLAEQVEVTRAVLDTADDMIVSIDDAGRIVAANASLLADLGVGEDDLVGRDIFSAILAPADHGRIRAAFALVSAGEVPVGRDGRFEAEFRRSDGATFPVEISATITGNPDERVTHVFARDISSRRIAEESAREHLHDLAQLLAVARDLGRATAPSDGRDAICEAARDLAGADLALFFEAQPDEPVLVATGVAGESNVPNTITLDGRTSMTARVFANPRAEFVADLEADHRIDHAVAVGMGVRSAHFQPVMRDGKPIGILVVYWRNVRLDVSERIRSLLELFAMQAAGVVERADLVSRLETLARTDSLTGLANRRALEESLVAELARADRSGKPLSVIMLDIDHFKAYNDEHGHQAGDRLLRDLATTWRRELRPTDTLARYGGEEFLAVLPAATLDGAVVIADRLRSAMPGAVTTSAGVAMWEGHETMSDLVARADAALYEAKRLGRHQTRASRSATPSSVDAQASPAGSAPGRGRSAGAAANRPG
ncbi:MAG TPA: diguanylate cyclase [Candidatus Limnocylindrales bacterium]|nr:diguanylate cyclase [Candidatus Limnocylindrales bacterium]